jgi:hypothetical protein
MRSLNLTLGSFAVIAACGGTTAGVDGGSDASNDGSATDSPADVISVDAAECTPPNMKCATPCPSGTFCLRVSGPVENDLGCTPIPAACNGTASCACMKDCFCNGTIDMCVDEQTDLMCNNGAISRRAFKTDITYVSDAERSSLASETVSSSLRPPRTDMELYGYTSKLLATVQEQQRQIDALKNDLSALKK